MSAYEYDIPMKIIASGIILLIFVVTLMTLFFLGLIVFGSAFLIMWGLADGLTGNFTLLSLIKILVGVSGIVFCEFVYELWRNR